MRKYQREDIQHLVCSRLFHEVIALSVEDDGLYANIGGNVIRISESRKLPNFSNHQELFAVTDQLTNCILKLQSINKDKYNNIVSFMAKYATRGRMLMGEQT